MSLLAYDGALTLKDCCAAPHNRCRPAALEDVQRWLLRRPADVRHAVLVWLEEQAAEPLVDGTVADSNLQPW